MGQEIRKHTIHLYFSRMSLLSIIFQNSTGKICCLRTRPIWFQCLFFKSFFLPFAFVFFCFYRVFFLRVNIHFLWILFILYQTIGDPVHDLKVSHEIDKTPPPNFNSNTLAILSFGCTLNCL